MKATHASKESFVGILLSVPPLSVLLPGDLLVGIEGAAVVTFRDVDNAIRGKATVKVSLIRDGEEKEIEVKVSALGSDGTDRLVEWAGMVLQQTPRSHLNSQPSSSVKVL